MTLHHHDASLWKGAVAGAVGGAVAGFVVDKAQSLVVPQVRHGLHEARESLRAVAARHERERAASGNGHGGRTGLPHAHSRAHVTLESGGREQAVQIDAPERAEATEQVLTREEPRAPRAARPAPAPTEPPAPRAAHYAVAVASGAAYGASAEYDARVTWGYGTAFGAAAWLLADEVVVPALGLDGARAESSPDARVSALASHLVYGATTELVRRNVRRVLD